MARMAFEARLWAVGIIRLFFFEMLSYVDTSKRRRHADYPLMADQTRLLVFDNIEVH